MKLITMEELEEGMILAEDILGRHDIVYATSGTVLTEKLIDGIYKLNINRVYVHGNDSMNSPTIIDKQLNKEYHNTINTFKNIYFNAKVGQKIIVEEIENSINPLIEEVVKSNNILGRLRQIEVNDQYTYEHSIDVCLISTMIGKWLGYNNRDLNNLALAGLLHDIGKSKVPASILNKPDRLTEEEFEIIKTHTTLGYRMVKEVEGISDDIKYGVLQHHERMDGEGYPIGLKDKDIHQFARIIAVADVYNAMTSDRVYKLKVSPFKVAEQIYENGFGHLDPYIVNIFIKNISQFYVGNIVKLNTGEIAEVVLVNKSTPTRPLICVGDRFVDLAKDYKFEIIDMIS